MSTAPTPWPPSGEATPPPVPEMYASPAAPPADAYPQAYAPAPGVRPPLPLALTTKRPGLAAFLSIFPGLGNVYNGLYLRGFVFFVLFTSMIGIVSNNGEAGVIFGPAIAFLWFFGLIDAYRQAVLINHGYQQDLGMNDLPKMPRAGQGGIVAGVLLMLVGAYALLEQYVNIDLDWLFDLWPVVLIALGAWLVWGTIRDRNRQSV